MLTGLFLQLALGPVFFYILGITIDSNYVNSLSAVAAVTLADYIYIVLSLIGIGQLLQKEKIKRGFGIASSIILGLFGFMLISKGVVAASNDIPQAGLIVWTPLNSFTSCFALTLSSPLTIVFWGSVFSAKAIEKKYKNRELVIFGIGTGASTFIFLSVVMLGVSFIKPGIPNMIVQILNGLVGLALVYYGITRAITSAGDKKPASGSNVP